MGGIAAEGVAEVVVADLEVGPELCLRRHVKIGADQLAVAAVDAAPLHRVGLDAPRLDDTAEVEINAIEIAVENRVVCDLQLLKNTVVGCNALATA